MCVDGGAGGAGGGMPAGGMFKMGMGLGSLFMGSGHSEEEIAANNARAAAYDAAVVKADFTLSQGKQTYREWTHQLDVKYGQEIGDIQLEYQKLLDDATLKVDEIHSKQAQALGTAGASERRGKSAERLKTIIKGKAGQSIAQVSAAATMAKWMTNRKLKGSHIDLKRGHRQAFKESGAGVPTMIAPWVPLKKKSFGSRFASFAGEHLLPLVGTMFDAKAGKLGSDTMNGALTGGSKGVKPLNLDEVARYSSSNLTEDDYAWAKSISLNSSPGISSNLNLTGRGIN